MWGPLRFGARLERLPSKPKTLARATWICSESGSQTTAAPEPEKGTLSGNI